MAVTRRIRTRADRTEAPAPSSLATRRLRGKEDKPEQVKSGGQIIAKLISDQPFLKAIEHARATMQPTRPGHYLHVSDLLSKCIRKRVLLHRYKVRARSRRLTLADQLTFAQGDIIHDLLKSKARDGAPDELWGKWSCKCEYLRHDEPLTYAELDQNETCPHCKSKVDRYHEVSMFDEELWIVGNPDLILWMERLKAYHIVELKSMSPAQFENLNRPDASHVLQVVFYWYLMRRLGYSLTDRVSIVYASKGWMFESYKAQPTREFVIDPEAELHRLDDMLEDARAHKAAILEKRAPLPPRTQCSTDRSKDAKSCEVCHICFEV